jgi:hypothetical protein
LIAVTHESLNELLSEKGDEWNENYHLLKLYQEKEGHCVVPPPLNRLTKENLAMKLFLNELEKWVYQQRVEYKDRSNILKGKGSSNSGREYYKEVALNLHGFCWDVTNEPWMARSMVTAMFLWPRCTGRSTSMS